MLEGGTHLEGVGDGGQVEGMVAEIAYAVVGTGDGGREEGVVSEVVVPCVEVEVVRGLREFVG